MCHEIRLRVPAITALAAVVFLACADKPQASQSPQSKQQPRVAFQTGRDGVAGPMQTPVQLARSLEESCRAAQAAKGPLLLEFSANWCGDCKALAGLRAESPLREELARWTVAKVNVGDFHVHKTLQRAFGVKAIARWVVVRPEACDAPSEEWPAVAGRTLEPRSGVPVTPQELASWLGQHR